MRLGIYSVITLSTKVEQVVITLKRWEIVACMEKILRRVFPVLGISCRGPVENARKMSESEDLETGPVSVVRQQHTVLQQCTFGAAVCPFIQ